MTEFFNFSCIFGVFTQQVIVIDIVPLCSINDCITTVMTIIKLFCYRPTSNPFDLTSKVVELENLSPLKLVGRKAVQVQRSSNRSDPHMSLLSGLHAAFVSTNDR